VNRSGGIVSLKAIEEQLSKVQEHTKETALHTRETAEHSKIIANEIKAKKINERIRALSFEAGRIDRNPYKKNKKKSSSFIYSFIFSGILLFPAIIFYSSAPSVSTVCIILMVIAPLIVSFFISETIPDDRQRDVNLNRSRAIAKELNELSKKAKEIEAGFLR
jgi:cation transport ATPase